MTDDRPVHSANPRTIVGYGWPWTVRAGDTIEFKVSTTTEGAYAADLVRIVCADGLSDPAMFKEKKVTAPFSGTYLGRRQEIYTGSYVEIAAKPCLDALESFTVQAMVFPTALPLSPVKTIAGMPRDRLPRPLRNQHLISRWNNSSRSGWALLIDENNCPAFQIGDGKTWHRTSLPAALVEKHWFSVVASYDASHARIRMSVYAVAKTPCELLTWPKAMVEESAPDSLFPIQQGPLRFGAAMDGPGNCSMLKPGFAFNGRLDRIRLCVGPIDPEESRALGGTQIPDSLGPQVVGFWDFGKGIDTINVHDYSGNGLNGVTVNLPTRGVVGVAWDGSTHDWRQRPDLYSAIHFHDDDLYDAEWATDFRYRVPAGLPSGIYAARLRQGESEDYIPFFVAPPKGTVTASVALLLPTTSYTAYANVLWNATWKKRIPLDQSEWVVIEKDPYPIVLRNAEDERFVAQGLRDRNLGKGVYQNHTDGSLCNTASQKYPNIPIKPKAQNYTLVADTYITDWLEWAGIAYDVLTDDLVQAEGAELLKKYRAVITGNHPEYCSVQMLDAVTEYQQQGGRWLYLGGNGFFWVASYHSQLRGAVEVRKDILYAGIHPPYETRHAFDGQAGGLWSRNGRPSQLLMGVGPVLPLSFEGSAPYTRLPQSYNPRAAFIFAGVSNVTFGDFGIIGGGAAGQETDEIDHTLGTPAHALHLARSCDFPWPLSGPDGMTAEEYRDNVKMPRADMVFFEGPKGGAVFSVGSMAWVGSLSHNNYENDVARITGNVLRRFLNRAPFGS